VNFATYLPVPPEFLEIHKTVATRGWLGLDHRLLDGTRIRPRLRTARNAIAWARDGVTIPIVVQEGYATRKEGETTHTVEEFVDNYRRSQEEIDVLIYEVRSAAGGCFQVPIASDAADNEEGRKALVLSLLDQQVFNELQATITLVMKERRPRGRANSGVKEISTHKR
jgi:hypothetical protein